MNTLVSFVVPAYNVGKYIVQCVESIKNQTYPNIEIIVINDGSTDNTKDVVEGLVTSDSRIKLVNNTNKGVSATRNEGIEISKGEWIVFVDGDDYLACDYTEHMLSIAETTNADFCLSLNCYKTTNDKQVDNVQILKFTSDQATALLLSPRVAVGCWNKMFRRKVLIENAIRFKTDLFYGEGLHFITNFSMISNCVGVSNKRVYYYRQDNFASATKRFNVEKLTNGWEALNQIEQSLSNEMIDAKTMLSQHRFRFSYVAVHKILESQTVQENKDIYMFFLDYFRHNYHRHINDKEFGYKYKLLLTVSCISPKLLNGILNLKNQSRTNKSV